MLTTQAHSNMLTSGYSMNPVAGTSFAQITQMGDVFAPLTGVQTDQEEVGSAYMGTGPGDVSDKRGKNGLQSQDSFGRWINEIIVDSPESVDNPSFESSMDTSHGSLISSGAVNHEGPVPAQIFCITDISPSWAYSNEETKVSLMSINVLM